MLIILRRNFCNRAPHNRRNKLIPCAVFLNLFEIEIAVSCRKSIKVDPVGISAALKYASRSLKSPAYWRKEEVFYFKLLNHRVVLAFSRASVWFERSNPAKIAITAITIRSSIKVNFNLHIRDRERSNRFISDNGRTCFCCIFTLLVIDFSFESYEIIPLSGSASCDCLHYKIFPKKKQPLDRVVLFNIIFVQIHYFNEKYKFFYGKYCIFLCRM